MANLVDGHRTAVDEAPWAGRPPREWDCLDGGHQSEPDAVTAVMDSDGDEWRRVFDGSWTHSTDGVARLSRDSWADLLVDFGPLVEVIEDVPPQRPASSNDTGYYTELARDLHEVADAIATLAGREPAVGRLAYAQVSLCAGVVPSMHEQSVPVVDAIAATIGAQAGRSARASDQYEMRLMRGPLEIVVDACVPKPVDETAQLRAENERLRAQLAAKSTPTTTQVAAAILTPDSPDLPDGGAAMSDLYPTKTRLALLASVAARGVEREVDTGRDVECRSERTVTARMAELSAAGWVELEQKRWCRGPGSEVSYWQLTTTGRAHLRRRHRRCVVMGAYEDPAVRTAIREVISERLRAERHVVLRAVEALRNRGLDLDRHQAERLLSMWSGRHLLTDAQAREAVALYIGDRPADPAIDIEVTLRNATRSWRVAVDDDERAEALEYVLAAWYAAWPEDAVTDPHMPLAAEIVRLVADRPEYQLAITDAGQLWMCSRCGVVEATATCESPDPCVECDGTVADARWRQLYEEADQ